MILSKKSITLMKFEGNLESSIVLILAMKLTLLLLVLRLLFVFKDILDVQNNVSFILSLNKRQPSIPIDYKVIKKISNKIGKKALVLISNRFTNFLRDLDFVEEQAPNSKGVITYTKEQGLAIELVTSNEPVEAQKPVPEDDDAVMDTPKTKTSLPTLNAPSKAQKPGPEDDDVVMDTPKTKTSLPTLNAPVKTEKFELQQSLFSSVSSQTKVFIQPLQMNTLLNSIYGNNQENAVISSQASQLSSISAYKK